MTYCREAHDHRGGAASSDGAQLVSSTLGVSLSESGKDRICQLSFSRPGQRRSTKDEAR